MSRTESARTNEACALVLEKGRSINSVSKELGISRLTIRRALLRRKMEEKKNKSEYAPLGAKGL